MYIVLTSKNRKLPLPLNYKDVISGEEVVSTNAPYGMLFVANQVLSSYFEIEKQDLDKGSIVCVPLFDDFKEFEKRRLLNEIENLDNM